MGLFDKIFGTHSEHELKRIYPIVDKIEGMREDMVALSDEELRAKTDEYKKRLADGETLDDLLPEAFATVREAARRVLSMEHFRVPWKERACISSRSTTIWQSVMRSGWERYMSF